MKATQGKVSSNTALLDLLHQHATLEGQNTRKEGRIRVDANLTDLEKTDMAKKVKILLLKSHLGLLLRMLKRNKF